MRDRSGACLSFYLDIKRGLVRWWRISVRGRRRGIVERRLRRQLVGREKAVVFGSVRVGRQRRIRRRAILGIRHRR